MTAQSKKSKSSRPATPKRECPYLEDGKVCGRTPLDDSIYCEKHRKRETGSGGGGMIMYEQAPKRGNDW